MFTFSALLSTLFTFSALLSSLFTFSALLWMLQFYYTMEDKNNNPLLILIAWLNYLVSYVFSAEVLNKIALILSIVCSIVYAYTSISKHINKNKDEKTN